MRILTETARRLSDADILQYLSSFLLGGLPLHSLVQRQRFADLRADGFERIQAGHRILHDHSDFLSAHAEPLFFRFKGGKVLFAVTDAAAGDAAVGIQQTHERFAEHGFTAAGFPHDGKALAFTDVEADTPNGVQCLAAEREFHFKILHR